MQLNTAQKLQISGVIAWDLKNPKQFLVTRQGFDPEYVDELEVEYKRYMALVVTRPDQKLPISNVVDELWHAHLLFTNDYRKMSDKLNGSYINHVPTLSEKERAALEPYYFNGTLQAYREVFGENPSNKFWPSESGSICWSCTGAP